MAAVKATRMAAVFQALVQFQDVGSAVAFMQFYQNSQANVRCGGTARLGHSC